MPGCRHIIIFFIMSVDIPHAQDWVFLYENECGMLLERYIQPSGSIRIHVQ